MAQSGKPPPPPQRSARHPAVLVVGKHGANNEVLVQALGLFGAHAHGALLADAPALLGAVRPHLVVVFGPDAEVGQIQHLVLAAGDTPIAVLAANDRQRQALGGFPPGSLMLVPRTDSELGAIARLAEFASGLARDSRVADRPSATHPPPIRSAAPRPAWALPPSSPRAEPAPPPSGAWAPSPVDRRSAPPPPPVRARRKGQSVPPPPPRRSTG